MNTVVRIVQEVRTQPLVFRVGISFPFDEVLEFVAEILGTENFLHHIFFYIFNDDRGWRGLDATRDSVFDMGREERDMENRMKTRKIRREREFVS